jgi:hypothetical protein
MKKTVLHLVSALSVLSTLAAQRTYAKTPSKEDLDRLRAEVAAISVEVDKLAAPYLSPDEIGHLWIGFDTFRAVSDALNRLSPYTLRFDATSVDGGFIGETWQCPTDCVVVTPKTPKIDQEKGWGVYAQPTQNMSGRITVSNVQYVQDDLRIVLSSDVGAVLNIPFRVALAPCAGANFIWDDVLTADASVSERAIFELTQDTDGSVRMRVSLTTPSTVPVNATLLQLPLPPEHTFTVSTGDWAGTVLDMRIPSLWAPTGRLTLPVGVKPQSVGYQFTANIVDIVRRDRGYLLKYSVHFKFPSVATTTPGVR